MKEYHGLQNTLYSNLKQVNIELNRFNYYHCNDSDGILLYSAVCHNFVGYVELLLKIGFDPNVKIGYRHSWDTTMVSFVKQMNNLLMLSLFEDAIKNNQENENKQETERMDAKSLSLRYDVMYRIYHVFFCFFFECFSHNKKEQLKNTI